MKLIHASLIIIGGVIRLTIIGFIVFNVIYIANALIPSSPLLTGAWEDEIFYNTWTHMSFELPQGFVVQPLLHTNRASGTVDDFRIRNDCIGIDISLKLIDVARGEMRDKTAEDYLNYIHSIMINSQAGTFTFNNDFEHIFIAGRDYAIMRGSLVNEEINMNVRYDFYAHRFVNTMMVFTVVYSCNCLSDDIYSFFNSINRHRIVLP